MMSVMLKNEKNGTMEFIEDAFSGNTINGVYTVEDMDGIADYGNKYNAWWNSLNHARSMNDIANSNHYGKRFGMQNHRTEKIIIDKMVDMVENLYDSKILVMYNEEIVESIVSYGCDESHITFMTDRLSRVLYLFSIGIKVRFVLIDGMEEIEGKMVGMKFDYIISNPPYDNRIDLKILETALPYCDKAIVVHPASFLLSNKENGHNGFINNFGENIKKTYIFGDGNKLFNIKLSCDMTITEFDMKNCQNGIVVKSNKINNIRNNDLYVAKSVKEITIYGSDYINLGINQFFERVKNYIGVRNNLYFNTVWNSYDKKLTDYGVNFGRLKGSTESDGKKDDFFTMVCKNEYSDFVNKDTILNCKEHAYDKKHPVWCFDSEDERNNFIDYCKSKFARFCLSYYKMNKNLASGELRIVPWMDFTQHWNDKILKEKFNISKEMWDYIDKFIPDYYDDYKFDM